MPAFPTPVGIGAGRTAFYSQTGSEVNAEPPARKDTGSNAPRTDIQSIAGPDVTDQIGASVHNAAMKGGDPTPNRRNILGDHPESFTPEPVDPIPAKNEPEIKAITEEEVKADMKKEEEAKKSDEKKKDAPVEAEKKAAKSAAENLKDVKKEEAKADAEEKAAVAEEKKAGEKAVEDSAAANEKAAKVVEDKKKEKVAAAEAGKDDTPPELKEKAAAPAKEEAAPAKEAAAPAKEEAASAKEAAPAKEATPAKEAAAPAAKPVAAAEAAETPLSGEEEDSAAAAPSLSQVAHKKRHHKKHKKHHKHKLPISEEERDPWVYEYTKDAINAIDYSENRLKDAPDYGYHPSNMAPNPPHWGAGGVKPADGWPTVPALVQHHKHHHKHHRDIGDNGINEEVHGFASADKSVLPQPWRRVKTAYPINGFKNDSWNWIDDKPAAKKSLS